MSEVVTPGDVVVVDVDVTVSFDSMRPDVLKVIDPDKLVLLHDHQVPAPTVRAANMAKDMREFVEKFGIKNYFPVGTHGISHVLVAQEGFALPGKILANPDSHTCSSGALNCLARGLGPSEMLYILCKGKTWFLVGPTTKVVLEGKLPERVYRTGHHPLHPGSVRRLRRPQPRVARRRPGRASDGRAPDHGDHLGRAVGRVLAVPLRRRPRGRTSKVGPSGPTSPCFPDADAEYEEVITVDLSSLEPQVVLPGKVARNSKPVSEVAGQKVDQAFIGSCANGRLSDFAVAAEIVKGKQVAAGNALHRDAGQPGHPEGGHQGGLRRDPDGGGRGGDELHLRRLLRWAHGTAGRRRGVHHRLDPELQGPHGEPEAEVFMGSPATVAASAVTGVITDPRGF